MTEVGSKAHDFDACGLFRATHSHICHWYIAPGHHYYKRYAASHDCGTSAAMASLHS